ncbi:MAG TPA: hypothetical protein VNQ73_13300 [Ilumatobacter sp.]|nr:hypothetical protein [Ilumatobacter sp.]
MKLPPIAVRAIFLLCAVGFVAQEEFRERHGEPYPALILPAFAGAYTPGDTITVTKPVAALVLESGERREVPIQAVVPPVNLLETSLAWSTYGNLTPEGSAEVAAWLRGHLHDSHPGLAVAAVEVSWEKQTFEVRSAKELDRVVTRTVRVELEPDT